MDEKMSVSGKEAESLLELAEMRIQMIKKLRQGGNERIVGWVSAILIILLPYLLGSDPTTTRLSSLIGLGAALGGHMRWNENRFNALVDFLEKEGLIRK